MATGWMKDELEAFYAIGHFYDTFIAVWSATETEKKAFYCSKNLWFLDTMNRELLQILILWRRAKISNTLILEFSKKCMSLFSPKSLAKFGEVFRDRHLNF